MLPSTTAVIRGLHLWYIMVLISGKYSVIKPFKAFLECQMSKDKPTAFLAIKMWNFDAMICHLSNT